MTLTFTETLEAVTERRRAMDAPLSERLQAFADEVRALDPGFASIATGWLTACAGVVRQVVASNRRDHAEFVLPDDEDQLRSD